MTASGEPAVLMRCEISAGFDLNESCDDLWECEVVMEKVEMADSIDEVRGIDFGDGRIVVLVKRDVVVDVGEGGEFSRALVCDEVDDMFRNCPEDCPFDSDPVPLENGPLGPEPTGIPFLPMVSEAVSAFGRSTDDDEDGWFESVADAECCDCEEPTVPSVLDSVGD